MQSRPYPDTMFISFADAPRMSVTGLHVPELRPYSEKSSQAPPDGPTLQECFHKDLTVAGLSPFLGKSSAGSL
jgi:hypothetical protein